MSYCRWSSDNFKCDVYCYEDVSGGWTTHVAASKAVGDIPPADDDLFMNDVEKWLLAHRKQMDFLATTERKPIGLPHDGKSFNDPDLQSFRGRLTMLKDAGYNVPAYVFETIDEEIKNAE